MSTQEQNTPQQKDACPVRVWMRTKATVGETQPQHYSKTDTLKQSNTCFRKQGAPLIIPARQRALDAFPAQYPGSCGQVSCTSAISSYAIFSSLSLMTLTAPFRVR